MAFQMIHMVIAYELLGKWQEISDRAQFILGSVAPDSVHMNPEYEVSDKVHSHLFEECGPWGDTQDYGRWLRNISEFHARASVKALTQKEKDYIDGICVHGLTDYCNDLYIWRRLQKKYLPVMSIDEFRESYYPEARGIDQWLYQNHAHRKEIMTFLSEGQPDELGGMMRREDIETEKHHLLEVQYAVPPVDISEYKFLSEQELWEFIDKSVIFIREQCIWHIR